MVRNRVFYENTALWPADSVKNPVFSFPLGVRPGQIKCDRATLCNESTRPPRARRAGASICPRNLGTHVEERDKRMLEAFLNGKRHLGRFGLPFAEAAILDPDNLYHRYFLPVLAKAGLRKIRLHDLRHTFGSLLIQNGASIVYVKEQMGHSSIQVTVDTYGHLIPGANVAFVDRLDTVAQHNAEHKSATIRNPGATGRKHRERRFQRKLLI